MDGPSLQPETVSTPATSSLFTSTFHAKRVPQNSQVDDGAPATPTSSRSPNYRVPPSGISPRTSVTKDSPPSSSPGTGLPPLTSSFPSETHGEQHGSHIPAPPLLPRTPFTFKTLPTASGRRRIAGPSVHDGMASETLITILRATSISPSHGSRLQQISPPVRRSRSPSPDPLQLLSSPPPKTPVSALRQRASPLKEIPNSILDSPQPRMQPQSHRPSQISPLTSSAQHPSHLARLDPPAPASPLANFTLYEDDEAVLGRATPSFVVHNESAQAPASPPPIQAVEPIPRLPSPAVDGGRRYPLRARTKQQEHPYLYDHIAYKRQLHSNPEAIVKNRELERLRRLTEPDDSQNDGPDADREFVAGEDSQEQTQDWAMDVDQELPESQIYRPSRRPHSLSHNRTVASRPISTSTSNGGEGEASVELPSVTVPPWEPAAFQETFSSDDDVPSIIARKVRGREEETRSDAAKIKRRRKRLAPFPLPLTPKTSDHGERSSPEVRD